MLNLSVKKKLVGMNLILVLAVMGLSVFFLARFSAVTESYHDIIRERLPQQRVAQLMGETLLGLRLNLNELAGVDRDQATARDFSQRAREKLAQLGGLQKAILEGTSDLGQVLPREKGLVVPACRQGGDMERLARRTGATGSRMGELAESIIQKQQHYLSLTNAIGWYDSASSAQGVVKQMVEVGRRLEDLANDDGARLLVMEIRRQEKNVLERSEQRYIDRLEKVCQQLIARAQGELKGQAQAYAQLAKSIFAQVLERVGLSRELKELIRQKLRAAQKDTEEAVGAMAQRAEDQMRASAEQAAEIESWARLLIMVVGSAVIVFCLVFGWLISTGISRVLSNTISTLSQAAEQVVAASSQVSSASQSLASGTSQQAANLEETTSSLEEVASMSKSNASSADQANNLMGEVSGVVVKANQSMSELTSSMQQMSEASQNIAKIIKTIDEIAFQTNLLALNAAVEAARAGEHGSGFAVVADEVRNLAMRAGEAAKSTAVLIDETVRRVQDGSGLVDQTNQAFSQVSSSAGQVGDLVREIASACAEQAQGVDQINQAMVAMDQVIQSNASNAEESASASEEMNAQAEQMKSIVGDLQKLVGAQRERRRQPNGRRAPGAVAPASASRLVAGPAQAGPGDPQVMLEDKDFYHF